MLVQQIENFLPVSTQLTLELQQQIIQVRNNINIPNHCNICNNIRMLHFKLVK